MNENVFFIAAVEDVHIVFLIFSLESCQLSLFGITRQASKQEGKMKKQRTFSTDEISTLKLHLWEKIENCVHFIRQAGKLFGMQLRKLQMTLVESPDDSQQFH